MAIDSDIQSDHEFTSRLLRIVALLERDFREEEALMEKMDYPDLRTRRAEHADLLAIERLLCMR